MKKITLLIVSCILFPTISFAYVEDGKNINNDIEFKFGLMKKAEDGSYFVYSETTNILFNTVNPDYRFGFSVKHSQEGNYTGHAIIYLPSSPKKISVTFGNDNAPMKYSKFDNDRIIKTSKVVYGYSWFLDMFFYEADPLGTWKIEIFINDNLKHTINFEVQPAIK